MVALDMTLACESWRRQVQAFKRMQYQGKRSVWSDVLVGQGPLFSVDRAVRYCSTLLPFISEII